MAQRALAAGPDHQKATALALAIEPDDSQALVLQRALVDHIGGTLRVVQSTEAAFTAFGESLPDVILISPLLAPSDEERIVAHLGTLGVDASHVRLLSIPRFADGANPSGKKGWFGQTKRNANGGCDPVTFANEVAEYLATASTFRQNSQDVGDIPAASKTTDTLAGLRIEHIEQLFERLDANSPASHGEASAKQAPPMPIAHADTPEKQASPSPAGQEQAATPQPPAMDLGQIGITPRPTSATRVPVEVSTGSAAPSPERITEAPRKSVETTSEVAISERNDMPTAAVHDSHIDTPADARLPRFLIPDERVPMSLRALLEEADGCLKMSFLTGAGACAVRVLDLLLAEQGFSGTDRSEQIQQLGKKHPSIAEAFLRGLSIVTNNSSAAWDEARVRLVIAILKAIAYEVYVLGPERKERAAYVIELLERFKAVPKNS